MPAFRQSPPLASAVPAMDGSWFPRTGSWLRGYAGPRERLSRPPTTDHRPPRPCGSTGPRIDCGDGQWRAVKQGDSTGLPPYLLRDTNSHLIAEECVTLDQRYGYADCGNGADTSARAIALLEGSVRLRRLKAESHHQPWLRESGGARVSSGLAWSRA